MCHNLGEILGCSIVRMLLPMHETIRTTVNDGVKMRRPVRRGSNNCLRFVRGVCWLKAKELGEQRETDRVRLWWTHAVVNRKRTDAAERINRKNLLGLDVTLKMRITVMRHDAAQILLHRGD